MKPRLLDLFCGAGGAAKGYADAGFEVVGVDLYPQPRYPFEFWQMDALAFVSNRREVWNTFSAVHASPPCQAFTNAQRIQKRSHPDLVGPVRDQLLMIGLPYVIENVEGAPLRDPLTMCGQMFGLRTYRHRLFETNFPVFQPFHQHHVAPQAKMGRPVKPGEFIQVVGNFSDVKLAREAMGIDWMTRDELREAIPPAYTRFVGQHLARHLERAA